jgi:glycosyltransferase involved in cell wall biosynthesis
MGSGYMTFSIIVVCLNEGEKLHKTVQSILDQTEEDYEIIIKDGGSADGSVEKLITAASNGRIKIYREKDSGIYDAMNQAVKHASGEYIFFLNCGDYFYQEDVLFRIKQFIEENKCRAERNPKIFYGNIRERQTGALVQSNPKMDDFGCYRNVPCHQACFYDRRLLASRGFDTGYLVRADYEHFLWCYYKAQAHTVYLPVTVASYEGGGFSESGENVRLSAREHKQIVGKYMPPAKVLRYRMLMLATLAPVRTYLAHNPVTARAYQTCKRRVYEVYRRVSGKRR